MKWVGRIRRTASESLEGLQIAVENIVNARLRSFLTTLGIVIGVMTVIAIVAIIQGLNASFQTQIANLGAHTLYVSKWAWFTNSREAWWELRNRKEMGRQELAAIERDATLAVAVAPMGMTQSDVKFGELEAPNVQIIGTNAQYLATGAGSVAAGRFLAETDVDLTRSTVILGADVADRLFPGVALEQVLQKKVFISSKMFIVAGVLERRGQLMGQNMDSNAVIPYTAFLRDFGAKRSFNIAVTSAPENLSGLEDQIVEILRRVRRVPPEKKDDFSINRQEQFLRTYNQLTSSLFAVAIGVGLITLLVGGIGIMNIMLVSVTERTREIGVRRALGARRSTILLQFLVESSIVSAVGGAIGTGLGLGIAQVVALVSPLAAAINPSAVAIGIGFSAAVGLVFGVWPAWRAARLDPVEALRHE